MPLTAQSVRSLAESPRTPPFGRVARCRWHPIRWLGPSPWSPPHRRPSPAQSAWSGALTHSQGWPAERPSLSLRQLKTCKRKVRLEAHFFPPCDYKCTTLTLFHKINMASSGCKHRNPQHCPTDHSLPQEIYIFGLQLQRGQLILASSPYETRNPESS